MAKPASFANTLSTQWMERTLDDSAIRRKYYLALWKFIENDMRKKLDPGLPSSMLFRKCGGARLTAVGMDLPEMMLLAEAVLIGLDNVTDGLVVYPARIRSRFLEELPFMVTEAVSIPSFREPVSLQ